MAKVFKYCAEFVGNLTGPEKKLPRLRRNDYSFSLAEVVQQINSNLFHLQIDAVRQLKFYISREGSILINAVVDAGLLPKLFEFLHHNNYDLVFEAVSTLKYIAFGADVIGGLIDLGNFNVLCKLLSSTRLDIIEQIIWLLGAICSFGTSNEYVEQLLDKIFLISDHPGQRLSLIRALAWTLSVFSFKNKKSTKDLLTLILNLLRSPYTGPTMSGLIETYKNLPATNSEMEIVDEAQYEEIPDLIDFVISDDDDTSILALRAITLINLQSETPSPILIDSTFLSTLMELFNHPQTILQHEVSVCTSAIMEKSSESAIALANSGLLQIINDKLLNSGDKELQKKCFCTLVLFVKIVPEKVDLFIEFNVFQGVCNFIKRYPTTNDETHIMLGILFLFLSTAEEFGHLETTVSVMKQNGGLDKLKELRAFKDDYNISASAKCLDLKYFSPEMEMQEDVDSDDDSDDDVDFLVEFLPLLWAHVTNYGVKVELD